MGDFDWDDLQMKIQRSWVAEVEDEVKTLYSKKWIDRTAVCLEAYWVGTPITGALYVLQRGNFVRISI
jgi:hypothetical protein